MSPRLVATLALGVLLWPVAGAQSDSYAYVRVSECSQACAPTDPDVNAGPLPRTGEAPVHSLLYVHYLDSLPARGEMNLQPVGAVEPRLFEGMGFPSLSTGTGTPGDFHFVNNVILWEATADDVDCAGDVCGVNRGLGFPGGIDLVGDALWLYLYLSADLPPTSASGAPSVQAMPALGIRARVETGRHVGGEDNLLIAEGDTGSTDVAGFLPSLDRAHLVGLTPGSPPVWEFRVPLRVVTPHIPGVLDGRPAASAGLLVSITVYQVSTHEGSLAGEGTGATMWDWRLVHGPEFPNRLLLQHGPPLVHRAMDLVLYGDELFVRWQMQPRFGSHDADSQSFRLFLEGPDAPSPTHAALGPATFRRDAEWNGELHPINVTWRMPAPSRDGSYAVTLVGRNLAGTYELVHGARFEVSGGRPLVPVIREHELVPVESPGPVLVELLLALVPLALWRRFRAS